MATKLEKPSRGALLKLLNLTVDDRRELELNRIQGVSDKYNKDYAEAALFALRGFGLESSTKIFGAKWKKLAGVTLTLDHIRELKIAPDSPVGMRIIELVGEAPVMPERGYVRSEYRYILPEVDKEYRLLCKQILTDENLTVEAIKGLIANFATGVETKSSEVVGEEPGEGY